MMTEGDTPANTTSSGSTSLKGVGKLFGQLFALLFAILGFASITTTSKETNLLLMALAFMVTLFYMVLLLATVLNLGVPFLMVTFLILGTVVTFIALMIISPVVAWIYFSLSIFILALVVLYYKYQREIPEKIKKLFEKPGEVELGPV